MELEEVFVSEAADIDRVVVDMVVVWSIAVVLDILAVGSVVAVVEIAAEEDIVGKSVMFVVVFG